MKRSLLGMTAIGLAIGALAAGIALADRSPAPTAAPLAVDNFRLVDNTGFAQELRRLVDVKAIVLVSQVNGDHRSRDAARALEAIKAANPDVEFMMLNSSLSDGRAEIIAEAKSQGYTIPVLDDDNQLVGEQLGVSYAGEAFVIEPRTLKVLYHGPVDAAGARGSARGYLAAALAQVRAGAPISVARVDGRGTAVAFPERSRGAQHASISYSRDIAPVLQAKCVTCHQAGGIGPFAMSNYAVVKGFAPMIREAIRTDTMPPWHPDPLVGRFAHDQSLTQDQIKTIVHWVEAGAPRGDGPDPLAVSQPVAQAWPLGQPDLVLNIPAFTIPASGVVQYQYPTSANPLTEGRWVRAATLMPGDRQGVHHILAGFISGEPRPGPGSAAQWEASYGEYAVGGESFNVPAGMGIYLPPGGSMGFQMHYTPYGREASDTSRMGLYFYPAGETPRLVLRHMVTTDNFIELPPNTPRHTEIAYSRFTKDAILYSAFLHTHYRGISGSLELVKPDGTRQMLINLPRYDFNWQRTYDFAEPVHVPAGSKLVSTYVYDNSVRNSANPDPDATVFWGDQSWEEMHYTSFYYQWADETVANMPAGKQSDANAPFRPFRIMGMLDDNLDDKVQLAETRGRIHEILAPRFAELDKDHDGGLDNAELTAGAAAIMGGFRPPDAPEPRPRAARP
jgi:mono/diheme cytochrome c family protein